MTDEFDAVALRSRSGLGLILWGTPTSEVRGRTLGGEPVHDRGAGSPTASISLTERIAHNRKGHSVDVKIGVTDSPRELIINSAQTPEEVEKAITKALGDASGVLALSDEKGRRYLVQAAKIAYVEIGEADGRRVGFGVGAEVIKTS